MTTLKRETKMLMNHLRFQRDKTEVKKEANKTNCHCEGSRKKN